MQKKHHPKIAMLETGGWGGIWHYTCCLGNALCDAGVDLTVITSTEYERPFDLKFQVAPIIRKNRGYIPNIFRVICCLLQLKPDAFHVQSWFSARRDWLFFKLCKLLKIPLVLTAHNLLPHDAQERDARFMQRAFRSIYSSASALITHSHANKEKLLKLIRQSVPAIRVIPHGNYQFFAQAQGFNHSDIRRDDRRGVRSEFIPPGEAKRIFLMCGAMRAYKGIDLALEAMVTLDKLDNMYLIVAGKPYSDVLENCRQKAKELGLSRHVIFLPGYHDNEKIAKLHIAADVVLFPYRDIFQSGSLQIALAFGKPIIATSVGSFPETLNQKNAWLVEAGAPDDIGGALQMALNASSAELEVMGTESHRISTVNHSWNVIAAETQKLYFSLQRRKSRPYSKGHKFSRPTGA